MTLEEHKKLGVQYFNKTWDYVDKPNRTIDEDIEMINYAHASRLHWKLSGAPVLNLVRGDWMIAKVYTLAKQGESALYFAKVCHDKTLENDIGDFDLVFAHEAMANAYKLLGNENAMNKHLELGYASIDQVAKKADKEYCRSELDKIK